MFDCTTASRIAAVVLCLWLSPFGKRKKYVFTVICHTILYHALLYYTILYDTIPYYNMPYSDIPYLKDSDSFQIAAGPRTRGSVLNLILPLWDGIS